ncbi:DNA-binding response regulator [Nonomuraea sp. NPDC004580]|uniref:response regulator transcription factor n=1 Tax=Nonomuraea sp. NPDC004580 TaxID=3154552 RepID=UPI0033B70B53
MIRVLVVDDQTLVRQGIRSLLGLSGDIEVAGEAGEPPAKVQPLTERELGVLRLIAEGYSNREIAEALFLAEGTVTNHVSALLAKLGARDRTNAVLRALHENVLG